MGRGAACGAYSGLEVSVFEAKPRDDTIKTKLKENSKVDEKQTR
jgi:hypothetical protein